MAKEKVGVVGAGLMGAEIALVFALAGHEVLLSDTGEAPLAAALERMGRALDRGVQRGWYKEEEKPLALSRVTTTVPLDPFAQCDFVTEAVFEDEGVKAETYRKLDALLPARAILASNTSTIPISTLASYVSEARRPNFVGTHYFSPASRMKLVEVIPHFDTSPETFDTAMRLMREADKVRRFCGQPHVPHLFERGGAAGRGGRRDAGGYRHRLQARPRPPDGAV
jgi:3-hydroxybutyryl-CoA dehydrogenase